VRPSFYDLTADQQLQFGNGIGPDWLSDRARAWITKSASWYFKDASWRRHDFGYSVGGDRWDRARCDWLFFIAMLRDAARQYRGNYRHLKFLTAVLISLAFYLAVRIFGQFGSFDYRVSYASLFEIVSGATNRAGQTARGNRPDLLR
jgi:hypothetical protein